MITFANRLEDDVGAAEKKLERQIPASIRSGSRAAFRRIAAEILANMPRSKKGASVVRELKKLRTRGGVLR